MKKSFSLKLLLTFLFAFVVGVGLSFPSGAADLNNVLKDISAKHAAFQKEVKDLTIEQETKVTASGSNITSTSKTFKKAKKFRVDSSTSIPGGAGNLETTIIYDGNDMWMISSFTGKKKLSSSEIKQYQNDKDWLGLASEKAKIVGSASVNGRNCYIAEITGDKEVGNTKLWIDKKSLSIVKGETKGAKGETISWISSDFRKLKGNWEIPYKTEIYIQSKLTSTTIVKSFAVNKNLSDDLFNPDKVKVANTKTGILPNFGGNKK